ncbi:MAG: bifunctional tRNA (5-methylaminomethyl-2-thiouridine)(34)-methyltransferase MnmD/FAD-dependent 5-carboxymethylaminomethyl-2-thiouridine(34) oxidoreductase MnmC [Methylococcales bacterium]|jgi:tRNA 5-methylaminomethyl-2-thiouridine biosynthesis bifunctional protein|nr:bifunctional tRNA (5-methylaminomethyl-2-thiouridine)(34)-methyltransferase MnmD/FAD-dependent 5-carboxymethylaminomethyl-2-thiouridine(34) oxidoreductase MnmC [Methylococcales bacterium]MBT7445497.1 bifunctional tRNA (5-methylaminomethyl-2-thiouridine)(34)-methyltransferase MnmD/FAD-dependent 5-carboxymethylaminomethyl-2-thiouridine(34) oxidoreductase MnmC [Methylococcales bacterium]
MKIEPAKLSWKNNEPWSDLFQDRYFSDHQGEAETKYVFFKHNLLTERWQADQPFTIAETGFGTGLNFLLTAQLWQRHTNNSWLSYVSFEKHPLQRQDLQRAQQLFPALKFISDALLPHYPPALAGQHLIVLPTLRIRLILIFGDIAQTLPQWHDKADAWFLDGFAPQRNSAMWSEATCQNIAQHTVKKGTFSTYAAAGFVRRQLNDSGFSVSKDSGFGVKREMLFGQYQPAQPAPPLTKPWFNLPATAHAKQACIIGGGIAGCSMAHALAEQGWDAHIFDRANTLASGASGNAKGILQPALTSDHKPSSQFYSQAFILTGQRIQQLQDAGAHIQQQVCGVVQQTGSSKQRQRQLKVHQSFGDIEHFLTKDTNTNNILYPSARWVAPASFCHALVDAFPKHINLHLNSHITHLTYQNQLWSVWHHDTCLHQSAVVILCTGYDSIQFSQAHEMPLAFVRGQISEIKATPKSAALQHIYCADGYIIPAENGRHVIGASFEPNDPNTDLSDLSQQLNINRINTSFGDTILPTHNPLSGRVSFRCSTPDYLPLIGPAPSAPHYQRDYAQLHHGNPRTTYPLGRYQPGLFLSTGYGSKGLTGALLGAQILTAMLNKQPVPVSRNVIEATHPARFIIKQLKRTKPGNTL